MSLVRKLGINDKKYKTSSNGVRLREYRLWMNMIERCSSEKLHERLPTYIGCEMSENFNHYSYFYEWCQDQIGFNCGFALDKDLLIKGNKIYSEDTCLFLPRKLNQILTKSDATRGDLPVGVSFDKQKGFFDSRLRLIGRSKFLGYFSCPIEAHNAYKVEKEKHIKYMANIYRDQIDPRAYDALMEYKVEITD